MEAMSLSEQITKFIQTPKLVIPSKTVNSLKLFYDIHSQALRDPAGMIYVHDPNSIERRIPYATQSNIMLQVIWTVADSRHVRLPIDSAMSQKEQRSACRQLGVIETDGSMMSIAVEEQQPLQTSLDDPFTKLILSYFEKYQRTNQQ